VGVSDDELMAMLRESLSPEDAASCLVLVSHSSRGSKMFLTRVITVLLEKIITCREHIEADHAQLAWLAAESCASCGQRAGGYARGYDGLRRCHTESRRCYRDYVSGVALAHLEGGHNGDLAG
jgi:hypothetical protein